MLKRKHYIALLLIVAVVVFYRSGVRSSTDAPPAVGTPVESMKVEAPLDAQPVDPEADIRVYRDGGAPTDAAPTFTPDSAAAAATAWPMRPLAPVIMIVMAMGGISPDSPEPAQGSGRWPGSCRTGASGPRPT